MTTAPAAPFGRVLTAMATAFADDGSVDLEGTAAIARHLVDNGNDGVVVSGTTGESPTTSVAEDGQILAAVKDAVGDRATVIAGVGTNSTAHSVELALQAEKIGVDGLLLVTPYYNKPSQAGLLHHFRSVVEATGVPVMLYDVPSRTATEIALSTYAEAITWEPVVAVKDAVGDYVRGVKLIEMGYALYSGDDVANLGWLAHGGCGFVERRRPRGRQRVRGHGRCLHRRRPRRGPADLHPTGPGDGGGDGGSELRGHHRQGHAPAARRTRQPQRARTPRAAGRLGGGGAACRARGLGSHLTSDKDST